MAGTHRTSNQRRARRMGRPSRRDFLRWATLGAFGSMSPWLPQLAAAAANHPQRRRACILLWMTGGPSQTDTFDMKPGHANGGPFKSAPSAIPGVHVSEHLPQVAGLMNHLAPIRSMSTKEGDHARATYLMRTGYRSQGPIHYPTMGSLLSKELASEGAALPDFVSVSPFASFSPAAYGPGFLGPSHAPLVVGRQNGAAAGQFNDRMLQVENLSSPADVDRTRADARLELLREAEQRFVSQRPASPVESHQTAYEKAVRMMRSEAAQAFNLSGEAEKLRDAYGRNRFGQGCLLARRLVERGVPFVEVSLNNAEGAPGLGWDTHVNNFDSVRKLCEVLDPAWATLLTDLENRRLLDSTLVVWMGEFGRTPNINDNAGRDHFPNAWTAVLGGGGIKGGGAFGQTSADGMEVKDRPVSAPDLIATICRALGIDPLGQNMSNVGRPIRLADPEAQPVEEILA